MPTVASHLVILPTELVTEICIWVWMQDPHPLRIARCLLRTHRIFGDEARRQLFVYLMLRDHDDLEGWLLFLKTSPCVLRLYRTVFIENPPFDALESIVSIMALRTSVSDHPLRLVLHRVNIGHLLSSMNREPWTIVREVTLYRCSYNEDNLRVLFTLTPHATSWNFPRRPRSSYTGHCGRPLPPISNALHMPALVHLRLSSEFGPTAAYQSLSWLTDLAGASASLQSLTIAVKAVDLFVVADILHGAKSSLKKLDLTLIEGSAALDLSFCTRLGHLSLDIHMSDLAFVGGLLQGASGLSTLLLNVTCDKRDYDLADTLPRWKQWLDSIQALDSVALRFSLEENRGKYQSWQRTLDEAMEISEQFLYRCYVRHGMSIVGGVKGTRSPTTFDNLDF
ncbi:uncharacterized protein ARMOST_08444 [Armillaria ostoyae]|uniref:F-box domain-containing protein n=1 Tax=Armillaria ostoyae TaxID=47428 RepID=A0A284R8Q6_ARMOS|nr:uncharacterized protein ARMOST_08444 [Armillaria ostoyae]